MFSTDAEWMKILPLEIGDINGYPWGTLHLIQSAWIRHSSQDRTCSVASHATSSLSKLHSENAPPYSQIFCTFFTLKWLKNDEISQAPCSFGKLFIWYGWYMFCVSVNVALVALSHMLMPNFLQNRRTRHRMVNIDHYTGAIVFW